MTNQEIKLKVMEAMQEEVNKGIVKIDSGFMKALNVNPGDVVKIKGERETAAIVERAYPGDIGLNIIRMDGDLRRNAKTSIGDLINIEKVEFKPAKKVSIAPARKGIMVKTSSPGIFKQGLMGRAMIKGDVISMGGSRRRKVTMSHNPIFESAFSMLDENLAGFGFGDLKFMVVDVDPKKEIVVVTKETIVEFLPKAVELKEDIPLVLGINYEDVGGLKEEIKKVREMIELPLKHPEVFEKLGIDAPKGVLLYGPPGTGKTLLAKAIASETKSNFLLINGPEVMSKFYGESEANLRKKFEEAENNAPSIIFIDEIDAIASKREETKGEVERRVVAQLLGLMDGLKSRGKVVVIAATNRPNSLDTALRRPGRFDREIEVGVPDKEGRLDVLKIHTRNMPLEGSLYGDIVTEMILQQIEQKINFLNKERKNKEKEIKKLEERKNNAEDNLIDKLVEKINGLDQELELNEKEYAEINNFKDKQLKQRIKVKKLANEIVDTCNSQSKLSIKDPRYEIIENKLSEQYGKLREWNLLGPIIDSAKRKGVERDLGKIANITHGFVGADLSALAKEAAMILLRRILPDLRLDDKESEPIPHEILEKLKITQKDFSEALKVVRPSAMREVLVETPDVSWKDIGGLKDIKERLEEAVEWPLKKPEVFERMGITPPRGILLYGPPGTGKTLLAKAVAKESEANFILVNGPSLLSKWVGESEKAVREIFRKARQTSPTILFFDEIDSLAPKRGRGNSDNGVTDKVVNQILTEMDGLESLNDVVIIAATNRPDIVDPALLRPGRFDRIIMAPVPSSEGREKIFEIHLKGMPLEGVTAKDLASRTEGYVGADIAGVCREAAMVALRENLNAKKVMMSHFEEALARVKPSVDKEIEKAYKELENYFKQAKAKEMQEETRHYFG
jgi:transitional endoplasmic reticulum ATPase